MINDQRHRLGLGIARGAASNPEDLDPQEITAAKRLKNLFILHVLVGHHSWRAIAFLFFLSKRKAAHIFCCCYIT